jgi:dimeric dUTPase (all-alpha-NTP-PPase superfamily)
LSTQLQLQKIREVLVLQDNFNKIVNPNWQTAGYPFYRAVWLELGEFVDGIGTWKWWKKAERGNREQCVLELVDVFHFVLSDAIIHRRNEDVIQGCYIKALKAKNTNAKDKDEYVFEEVETFIEFMLSSVRQGSGIPLNSFFDVLVSFDVTLDELLEKYVGKNVLNKFRQDFGYKSGGYIKKWDADNNEDNFYLVKFRDELGDSLTFDLLYDKLREKYQEVVLSKKG